jgi:hypothetical protein
MKNTITAFQNALKLSLDKVITPDGSIDETFVTIEQRRDLLVFGPDNPRPTHAVDPESEKLPWK